MRYQTMKDRSGLDLKHYTEGLSKLTAGLNRLWAALEAELEASGEKMEGQDIFTLAVNAIVKGQIATRCAHDQLSKVVLYPCARCGRFTIDEWYRKGNGYDKCLSVVEVDTLDEARALYRDFLALRESHYRPETDDYTSRDEYDNFIVTGSHCTCKEHLNIGQGGK